MEEAVEYRVQSHRLAAAFSLGMSITLLLTTPAGTAGMQPPSPGWVGLWLVTTLGCGLLGGMLLLRAPWRSLPMETRRGPALSYLMSVGLNILALALLVVSIDGMSPVVCLPAFAALGLAVLALQLFPRHTAKADDVFP